MARENERRELSERHGHLRRADVSRVVHRSRADWSSLATDLLAVADGEHHAGTAAARTRTRRAALVGQRDLRFACARLRRRNASVATNAFGSFGVDVLLVARGST